MLHTLYYIICCKYWYIINYVHSCMVISTSPFPTVESTDVNEPVIKLNLENGYITQLCNDVVYLLKMGDIMVADRTSLVERCCIFYNLLRIKCAGNCIVIQLALQVCLKTSLLLWDGSWQSSGKILRVPGWATSVPPLYDNLTATTKSIYTVQVILRTSASCTPNTSVVIHGLLGLIIVQGVSEW